VKFLFCGVASVAVQGWIQHGHFCGGEGGHRQPDIADGIPVIFAHPSFSI
jgi:hypothetical protein